jgi:hypothetical protein
VPKSEIREIAGSSQVRRYVRAVCKAVDDADAFSRPVDAMPQIACASSTGPGDMLGTRWGHAGDMDGCKSGETWGRSGRFRPRVLLFSQVARSA